MTALRTTAEDQNGWTRVSVAGVHMGGFGKTKRTIEDMRWYWSANGSFGHCATREQAIAELSEQVPSFLEAQAIDAAKLAQIEALPDHLRPLKIDMDKALFEQQRAWGANPFNAAEYRSTSERWYAARLAFDKAHDAWQSRRQVAA